jgi:hypothetical protein
LADTVSRGGPLATLNDVQLFERLFVQRQGQSESLLDAAQACSLVYSFDGENTSEDAEAELFRIARLIGTTADSVYRSVAELLRRDLAQRRGKFRAILPHALANRLAATALQNIPLVRIDDALIRGAPERLTISFSRRLGYLDTNEAKAIVGGWLGPEGWIGTHIWNLSEFGKKMFQNSVPANPHAALDALEANLPAHDADTPITTGHYVPKVLRLMAWESAFFERCATLLQLLAIYGDESIAQDAGKIHTSLFYFILSGTHATADQRAGIVRRLLNSSHLAEHALGRAALDAMMQTMHFSSEYDFQFGGRSRDYGYYPKTRDDVVQWYRTGLAIGAEIALSANPAAAVTKAVIAANFRGLWTLAELRSELEGIVSNIAAREFWRDCWLEVKRTRFYDAKSKESESYARLSKLEEMLRPRDLVQQVRGRVLSAKASMFGLEEMEEIDDVNKYHIEAKRRQVDAVEFGAKVARDRAAFEQLKDEIVTGQGNNYYFGEGLAKGAENPDELWHELRQRLVKKPPEDRDVRAFCGMLSELSATQPKLTEELLDDALESGPLAQFFPFLQTSLPLTPRGMSRLVRSIEIGKAPLLAYANAHLPPRFDAALAPDVARYILRLGETLDGQWIAIHILSTLFLVGQQKKSTFAPEFIVAGRESLRRMTFSRGNHGNDYALGRVVEVCLVGDDGCAIARGICDKLRTAHAAYEIYGYDHAHLIKALFKLQPEGALAGLLTGDEKDVLAGRRFIEQTGRVQPNALDDLSEVALFDWCGQDPAVRFPLVASVIPAFKLSKDSNPVAWAPIAERLVYSAPNPLPVMRELVARFRPMQWSGSRSAILDANASLLDQFDTRGNHELAMFIEVQRQSLREEARQELEWEARRDSDRDERFE